jgi:hypothetical protein
MAMVEAASTAAQVDASQSEGGCGSASRRKPTGCLGDANIDTDTIVDGGAKGDEGATTSICSMLVIESMFWSQDFDGDLVAGTCTLISYSDARYVVYSYV